MRIAAFVEIPVLLAFVCAASLAVSCGGETPPAAAPPPPPTVPAAPEGVDAAAPTADTTAPDAAASGQTAAPTAAAPADTVHWETKSHAERLDYMKTVVMPKMKDEFSAFDAKYAKMTCKTCHGDGAKDGTFKMPNAKLPKLSVEGNFKKHQDKTPDMLKFMMTKVAPDMASVLGLPAYDMATQKGFGCFDCHTMAK
jgi:hypothetical protein